MLLQHLLIILNVAAVSVVSEGQRALRPFESNATTLFFDKQYDQRDLFRRQESCQNPDYIPCSNGVNCCLPTDNCYPDLGMCCVKGGVTCGYQECYQAGAVCCSETGACNAAQNQTCCDTPAKSGCCDSGYSCCPAANTCCADDHTCCAAGCCSPGVECQDGECVTPLPVLELPYTPLVLDATVKNMCLWIRTQNPTNPNQVTLKYSSVRNDGGKCAGCCRYVTVAPGSVYAGEPTSCDEAPFARTYEASDAGAHLACVDAYENSFQGWWFGQWVRYTRANVPGFGDGSQFIVQITKLDCSTVLESDLQGCGSSSPPAVTTVKLLRTRQNGGSSTSGSETQVIPASVANSTSNLVIVALGDLSPGTYSMAADLSGSISDVMLWDNMGDDVDNSTNLSVGSLQSGKAFEFTVSTTVIGAGLLIETVQNDVNVTWNIRPPSSASSPAATNMQPPLSTTTIRSNSVPLVSVPVPIILMGLLFSLLT